MLDSDLFFISDSELEVFGNRCHQLPRLAAVPAFSNRVLSESKINCSRVLTCETPRWSAFPSPTTNAEKFNGPNVRPPSHHECSIADIEAMLCSVGRLQHRFHKARNLQNTAKNYTEFSAPPKDFQTRREQKAMRSCGKVHNITFIWPSIVHRCPEVYSSSSTVIFGISWYTDFSRFTPTCSLRIWATPQLESFTTRVGLAPSRFRWPCLEVTD